MIYRLFKSKINNLNSKIFIAKIRTSNPKTLKKYRHVEIVAKIPKELSDLPFLPKKTSEPLQL